MVLTFSVAIAAYEAASFIGDAVRSALDQDPAPLEVIVCDDGSTDDLSAALAEFGSAVRVIRIPHGGAAAAKNTAAAAASGEFVAFLDADDRYLPGRFAAIAALAMRRPELDVITTDAYFVHEGRRIGRAYSLGHQFALTDQRAAILDRNFVLTGTAVKRSRFGEIGGFDPTIAYASDWDLWLRLILSGSRVGLVPQPLLEYRLHERAMSAQRAAMSRGILETLTRAAARSDLTDAERAILDERRKREAAFLAREEFKESLLAGSPGIRRAAVRLASSSAQPPAARLKALAAMLAPAIGRRRLAAKRQRFFTTAADLRLER